MALLSIDDRDGARWACRMVGGPATSEEASQWRSIVALFVTYAASAREIQLFTLSPVNRSIAESLPISRRLRVGRTDVLINRAQRLSENWLVEIASSEDFERGLTWISEPLTDAQQEALAGIMGPTMTATEPEIGPWEVLMCMDDGDCLYWMNPSRPIGQLCQNIRDLSDGYGWAIQQASEAQGDKCT